jgi:phosphocarrier protein
MMLAAAQGSTVTIRCEGNDEEAALQAVADLIANRFDEES